MPLVPLCVPRPRQEILDLEGKLVGLREEHEKIQQLGFGQKCRWTFVRSGRFQYWERLLFVAVQSCGCMRERTLQTGACRDADTVDEVKLPACCNPRLCLVPLRLD